MKLQLVDGTSREVPLARGYVGPKATAVTLAKEDVDAMRRLAWNHPTMFNIVMRQLAARFEEGGDVMEVNRGN